MRYKTPAIMRSSSLKGGCRRPIDLLPYMLRSGVLLPQDPLSGRRRILHPIGVVALQIIMSTNWRERGLTLYDVRCSGATTKDLLGASSDSPAQLDAVDRDTKLVTVTIGGNDIGYIRGLYMASCLWLHNKTSAAGENCRSVAFPTEKSYIELEIKMRGLAAEVRRRAPAARLVFVDYPEVLPSRGICAATPMTSVQAVESRLIARRLVAITARFAIKVARN